MTKNEEIEVLANIIGSLPEDSYLRPCLTRMQPEIERDIRNDIIPDPYPEMKRLQALVKTNAEELFRIRAEISEREADARVACAHLAGHRRLLREWAESQLPTLDRLRDSISHTAKT